MARTPGSLGMALVVTIAAITSRAELTSWTPAVTRRLPIRRLARALAMSMVPHESAAPSPVNSPKGIRAA